MKKSLTLIFLLFSILSFTQNKTGTITDIRDGKIYKTVVIGNQTWMAENLNVSTFRNGDSIPEAKTLEKWKEAEEKKQPAWSYFDNNRTNGDKYGKLYNWYAVNDTRGLPPPGYHIPTDTEWKNLSKFLGGVEIAGKKMKSKIGWEKNANGNNKSGFTGLPGGHRLTNGSCVEIGEFGYWWNDSKGGAWISRYPDLFLTNQSLYVLDYNKGNGLSVRCIKD